MSSPLTAIDSCSRLSPHIAFGTISVKEIYQATTDRLQNLRHISTDLKKDWSQSLKSFSVGFVGIAILFKNWSRSPKLNLET